MVLPTGLTSFTPEEHAAYHNEIDTVLAWLNLPTVNTATPSGHVTHHNTLHAWLDNLPQVSARLGNHVSSHNSIHTDCNNLTTVLVSDSNASTQTKINAAPSTGVIFFEGGTHAERKATYRVGQRWRGNPNGSTIFDGSRVVTGWTGSNPWVANHTIADRGIVGDTGGVPTTPADVGAQFPEELFFETIGQNTGWTRKRREGIPSTSAPPAGAWTISYSAGTLRVAEDPTSVNVRVSVTDVAIAMPALAAGGGSFMDITFQKYAGETRQSPWGFNTQHRDLTFKRATTLDCHGSSCAIGPGDTITNCKFGYAGQIGPYSATLSGGYSAGYTFTNNEVLRNMQAPYKWDWEGGGSKMDSGSGTNGQVVVRNNWFHHNQGPGIWFDENATEDAQVYIESNLVEDNQINGIFWEVSGNPIDIRWNTCLRNGVGSVGNVGGGDTPNDDSGNGITISNSSHATYGVRVYSNKIDGCLTGILLQDEARSPLLSNVRVGNEGANHIRYRRDISNGNLIKFRDNVGDDTGINACGADNNKYYDTSAADRWFNYSTTALGTFAAWQAVRTGTGLTGALDTNGQAGLTNATIPDPVGFVSFTTSNYGSGSG